MVKGRLVCVKQRHKSATAKADKDSKRGNYSEKNLDESNESWKKGGLLVNGIINQLLVAYILGYW